MKNNDLPRDAVRFPSVNDSIDRHGNGYRRRDFLKIIGTAAGAACLALMPDGALPHIDISMRTPRPADIPGFAAHQKRWRENAG